MFASSYPAPTSALTPLQFLSLIFSLLSFSYSFPAPKYFFYPISLFHPLPSSSLFPLSLVLTSSTSSIHPFTHLTLPMSPPSCSPLPSRLTRGRRTPRVSSVPTLWTIELLAGEIVMEIQLRRIGGGGGGVVRSNTRLYVLLQAEVGRGRGLTAPFSAEQCLFLPIHKNNSPRFRKVGHK